MKKPTKQQEAEQSNARTKRFSLPNAHTKSVKLQSSLIDAVTKGFSKDIVAERENLTVRSIVGKSPHHESKLDSSLIEVSKRPAVPRGVRGRKSIGTLMPSAELTADFTALMPLIEINKQPAKDAYSFKSTSSDEDTRSSFAAAVAAPNHIETNGHDQVHQNGHGHEESAHQNGFAVSMKEEPMQVAVEAPVVRKRGRPSWASKAAAAAVVLNTDAPTKNNTPAAKAIKTELVEPGDRASEFTKPRARPTRRKSIGGIPTTELRKTSPVVKTRTRSVRKSLGSGTVDLVTAKLEPKEASNGRPPKRGAQEKTTTPAKTGTRGRSSSRRRDTSRARKKVKEEQSVEAEDDATAASDDDEEEEPEVVPKTARVNGRKSTKAKVKPEEEEDVVEDDSSEDDESEDEESSDEIELEYTFLQKANMILKKAPVCNVCEMSDSSVRECEGSCQRAFHPDCLGVMACDVDSLKCDECTSGAHACFMCKKTAREANDNIRKCSSGSCGCYYHEGCVRAHEGLFRLEQSSNGNKMTFTCPLHTCKTCWNETIQSMQSSRNRSLLEENDDDSAAATATTTTTTTKSSTPHSSSAIKAQKGKLVKCIRCPTAYHASELCLAAGTIVLGGGNILCPNHFKPVKRELNHRLVNVHWCFACVQPGELIGCNKCPAAYHYECIENASPELLESFKEYLRNFKVAKEKKPQIKSEPTVPNGGPVSRPDSPGAASVISNTNTNVTTVSSSATSTTIDHFNWTCEDCMNDRRPCYGDIVWSKVGSYRWWPGQIVHPRNLPERLREKWHQVGEFPVKFFGTHDHYWVTINRCFAFAQEDDCQSVSMNSALAAAYRKGGRQAKIACARLNELKRARFQVDRTKRSALKSAKFDFHYIRTNRPYGNIVMHRIPIADYPHCECDPKSANPCSTDDCVNRALKYECHPARCPAGDRCQNQRFVKRQYPKQEPLPTGERGWGLRTKVDIKKGEFVNEYVGELIDEEECKRRLRQANENNVTNFYFLTIDKDRIIDAGPKGNLARFMNHSCEPNVETQKWMVNGDVRVGLFAKIDIPAGTELTFNYNLDCLSNEKAVCYCGAKNCSGFIGDRPKNSAATGGDQANGNPRKRKLSEVQSTVNKSKKTVNGTNAGAAATATVKTPGSSKRKSLPAVSSKTPK